jgi:PEP-CTERM motif
MKKSLLSFAAALSVSLMAALPAQAADVYLTPASQTVALSQGTATLELWMNFSTAEATLGGGIDFDLQGPVSYASFAPSAYFTTAGDPLLSGWGTLRADADFEVHIGNFAGLSGNNLLGTITVNLLDYGTGTLTPATNTFWGGFYSLGGNAQTVSMSPASVTIVPEPASGLLLLAGAAAVALHLRRVRSAC